ncbi:hypothetical protein L1049_020130 [Liquidambar formosana]|uniref:cysteine--tRNA ligase n=1 Tax=Liquidambar formosana TaxID=63359 RepID=A0AAP0SCP5_LIQFO
MYVCGVTPYDYSHLGHARSAVAFDVLYRYLRHLGYEVTYVRNFTDIDDKIINKAKKLKPSPLTAEDLKESALKLSNHFSEEYLKDMDVLQCLKPTLQPRVSEHMGVIKDLITKIIKNQCAYIVDGDDGDDKDVYFSVEKFQTYGNYGQLSGRRPEDNRAGERVAIDPRKQKPADFALWKAAKPGEPSWEMPWGLGRPGWHIECSAMSAEYLSHSFDIHGGGIDLIFPHHENEIAQSCAAYPESNVSYWMHNGHVTNNNEKMSKSLGNFFTIRQITEQYHPLAVRYFLMSTHYRSDVNYSTQQLEQASNEVFYIYQKQRNLLASLAELQNEVKEVLRVLGLLSTLPNSEAILPYSEVINVYRHVVYNFDNDSFSWIRFIDKVFLFLLKQVLQQLKDKALTRAGLTEADVLHLINERDVARKKKDFHKADRIRNDLAAKGISLMDVGSKTIWRPCVVASAQQESPGCGQV